MFKVVTLGALTLARSTFFLFFSKDRLLDSSPTFSFFHYFASLGNQCISQNAIFKKDIFHCLEKRDKHFRYRHFIHQPHFYISCYKIVLLNIQRMVCVFIYWLDPSSHDLLLFLFLFSAFYDYQNFRVQQTVTSCVTIRHGDHVPLTKYNSGNYLSKFHLKKDNSYNTTTQPIGRNRKMRNPTSKMGDLEKEFGNFYHSLGCHIC